MDEDDGMGLGDSRRGELLHVHLVGVDMLALAVERVVAADIEIGASVAVGAGGGYQSQQVQTKL